MNRLFPCFAALAASTAATAQTPAPPPPPQEAPTGSLLVEIDPPPPGPTGKVESHALRMVSLFALASPEAREFQKHDLIQIVVRETSLAKSTHELDTSKEWTLDGAIDAFPDIQLEDLLNLIIRAGGTSTLPAWNVHNDKEFKGDGEYKRQDDFTARLTAEVLEVLPNGNLVLEARTEIVTDKEQSVMKVTGICRALDVTAANTVLSNQLHDLKIEKVHKGELRDANTKGILARVLDTLFAF